MILFLDELLAYEIHLSVLLEHSHIRLFTRCGRCLPGSAISVEGLWWGPYVTLAASHGCFVAQLQWCGQNSAAFYSPCIIMPWHLIYFFIAPASIPCQNPKSGIWMPLRHWEVWIVWLANQLANHRVSSAVTPWLCCSHPWTWADHSSQSSTLRKAAVRDVGKFSRDCLISATFRSKNNKAGLTRSKFPQWFILLVKQGLLMLH